MVGVSAERLVFVDETGTSTRMTPLYARAPRGRRAYGTAPRNHRRNTTLVSGLTLGGLVAPMVIEGAMDRAAFLAWLRHMPLPALARGRVVVMDNLSVHKGDEVRRVVEGAGHRLVFLPAYSPDFSPIEGAYSKVKQALRRAAGRTQAALEGAIGAAVDTVTARDAIGWFRHCGYHPTGHLS